jgi:Tfp pilus assembly protein PilX
MVTRRYTSVPSNTAQRGVVLLIALVALVAMTLGAIALIRSTDTASQIAANLAYRQTGVQGGDIGTQAAIDWLKANELPSQATDADKGYYAVDAPNLDVTGQATPDNKVDDVDWLGDVAEAGTQAIAVGAAPDAAGNRFYYVIHRLCGDVGVPTERCVMRKVSGSPGNAKDVVSVPEPGAGPDPLVPMFRVTTLILGPKNTRTFVQTLVSPG